MAAARLLDALDGHGLASQLDYVDIDSGHWPMFTKPRELAQILATCADG